MVEDLAEGDHLAQARDLQAELVLHLQAQVREVADDMVGRVDGHFLRAGHAHGGIGEHAHHVLDAVQVQAGCRRFPARRSPRRRPAGRG